MKPSESYHRINPSGLTLIEVLIAVAVLSIGLAGIASMHLTSLQYVHSAYHRSLASTIALDFEERLWLALADHALAGCPDSGSGEGSVAEALVADWNRDTPGEDWNWPAAIPMSIPNLTVETGIAVTSESYTEFPITLNWHEDRFSDAEPTTEQFDYSVRILCRSGAAGEEPAS